MSWLLVAALAALSTWALAFRPQLEVGPAGQHEAVTYPLSRTEFTDARSVSLAVQRSVPYSIVVRTGGTLTAWSCSPGRAWRSGDVPLAIDGRPIAVLATATPLYRALTGGESGEDVVGVQQALRDLGYDAPDSGEFDPATRGALAQFFADRQIRPEEQTPEGALQLEDVLWLPSPAVTLEGCEVGLGQDVSEGQAVATTRGDITALTFPVPDGLHAGPRHIILEGYRPVPAQDSGRLTDSALIRWLEEQNGAALDLASSQEGAPMTLPARFELIEPIEVYGVPPSALIGVAGQSVCVNDGESTIRAAIVASSLGVTYLTFENAQVPPSVRLEPDRGLRCG